MKIILSPAKTFAKELINSNQKPYFHSEATILMKKLNQLSLKKIKKGMNLSDDLIRDVKGYIDQFGKSSYQAITSYDGIAYKALCVSKMTHEQQDYVNDHVFILSGLYGILKPYDGISLYRLEMKDRTLFNLYHFWTDKINTYLSQFHDEPLINLASDEYSKVITKPMITLDFVVIKNNKETRPAFWMKHLRGLFAREIMIHQYQDPSLLKQIEVEGFHFDPKRSNDKLYCYVKEE